MKLTVLVCILAAACMWAATAGATPVRDPSWRTPPASHVGVPTQAIAVRPDDRGGLRLPGVTSLPTSLRPDDRAGFRGVGHAAYATARSDAQSATGAASGFDWSSAGVGAIVGVAAAIVVLLGWALALRRSHRRVEASA